MLVFGLPGHALLLRKTSAKLWIYGAAGIVIGLAGGAFRYFQARTHLAARPDTVSRHWRRDGNTRRLIFWFARRPDRMRRSTRAEHAHAAPLEQHSDPGKDRRPPLPPTILCGPLAGLAIVFIIALITVLSSLRYGGSFMPVAVFFSGGASGAAIGWPATPLFGLPAHAFLYKRRSHKIGGYLLAAASSACSRRW